MDILAANKREERKLERQLGKLNHQLDGVRAAAKALGHSTEREVVGVKKRVLSAAGRAAIAKAAYGVSGWPGARRSAMRSWTPWSRVSRSKVPTQQSGRPSTTFSFFRAAVRLGRRYDGYSVACDSRGRTIGNKNMS